MSRQPALNESRHSARDFRRSLWAAVLVAVCMAIFFLTTLAICQLAVEFDPLRKYVRQAQFRRALARLTNRAEAATGALRNEFDWLEETTDDWFRDHVQSMAPRFAVRLEEHPDLVFIGFSARGGALALAERRGDGSLWTYWRKYPSDRLTVQLPKTGKITPKTSGPAPDLLMEPAVGDDWAQPWLDGSYGTDPPRWGEVHPGKGPLSLSGNRADACRIVPTNDRSAGAVLVAGLGLGNIASRLAECTVGSDTILIFTDRSGKPIATSPSPNGVTGGDAAGTPARSSGRPDADARDPLIQWGAEQAAKHVISPAPGGDEQVLRFGDNHYALQAAAIKDGEGTLGTLVLLAPEPESRTGAIIAIAVHVIAAIGAVKWASETRPPRSTLAHLPGTQPSQRRAMVVDDDPAVRADTAAILARHKVLVTSVDGYKAALKAWARNEFDFVLMDLEMPRKDGCATAAAMRAKSRSSRRVPIFCLTSAATPENHERVLRAGMDGLLAKPLDVRVLAAAYRQFKQSARRLSS